MTSFAGEHTEPAKPSASFGPSLVTTQTWLVQQTPALAVWKYNVRSKNPKLCKFKKCPWRNGPSVNLMNNINLLITFVCRRYAVVFLRSLPSYVVCHLKWCMHVFVLTYYDIFWPLSALTSKKRCFILAHNIRPKFGRTFNTCSVSLPKPSASAECHNLTFGPSLVCKHIDSQLLIITC